MAHKRYAARATTAFQIFTDSLEQIYEHEHQETKVIRDNTDFLW